ncbi:hypothetical protein [Hydrogenophaga sp.]|uniref:hypothetical protein n=1 Tax=Hydrogenophaga sp. TaxID=1904254 RepID=UPI002732103C|nr:hypothetical protein [Hydrogenophaga sp.]MDP2015936.1 hypothetical protein [Hydrogenophaga sp.]MDP3167543.1 hypothetical protein [Hydrogenophaga sp.]MDP3812497.1 hypothetical protein [Hydrogenophaga sp.]
MQTPSSTHPRAGLFRICAAALALLALSGCASVFLVDNQVQSYARWADRPTPSGASAPAAIPQAPQVFRFDRLPSQQDKRGGAGQGELEKLTTLSMAKVGWTPAAAGVTAPWTVEVSGGTLRLPRAPWESPYDGYWGGGFGPGFGFPGRDYVVTGTGQIIYAPMFLRMDTPYYQREVSLVIRHAASGRVVYETRAAHDGRWNSSNALWLAMLDAALRDFPAPPEGLRQINIEVPR